MRALTSEVLTIAFFVIVGWAALWPARTRLGALTYHLAALPTGLLAAPLALAFSSVTRRPLGAASAAAGAMLLIALLWIAQRVVFDDAPEPLAVGPLSYLAAACAVLGFGTFFGLLRLSATNFDSISSYWPLGVELSRKGAFTVIVASSRSPLIPAMNAVHILFGSDWAYAIYPLLGVTLALWLGMTLWSGPLAGPGVTPRAKRLVAGGAVAFLLLEPSYLFNLFMVHSQMISALYLLIAVTSLLTAVRPREQGVNRGLLLVAGVATAGAALSRPDGMAYQFVPIAVAISALTISTVSWRSVTAFFAPLLTLVFVVNAAAFQRLGVWKASKLDGATVLAILVVLALSSLGPWLVQRIDAMGLRVRGERFLGVLVPVSAVLLAAVLALKWGSARIALANAGINLFLGPGGYFYLWYAVVILLILTAISGDALRAESWTRPAFLSVMLFLVIAGLVHGLSHEGRIGAGDSFNRVIFEILPVVVWFGGAVIARVLGPSALEESFAPTTVAAAGEGVAE